MENGKRQFLIFIDESGDHVLQPNDKEYPVFALAACIIDRREYVNHLTPELTELKLKYFGTDTVILHERDIRKKTGNFSMLKNIGIFENFMADINGIMQKTEYTVISAVIDKIAHQKKYRYPEHVYHLACDFSMERIKLFLDSQNAFQEKTIITFESRGDKEDKDLKLHFLQICHYNKWTNFDILFVPKITNSPGLQFADLMARPIGRWVMDNKQPNRAFEIIKNKFRTHNGKFMGYGLKIFP